MLDMGGGQDVKRWQPELEGHVIPVISKWLEMLSENS